VFGTIAAMDDYELESTRRSLVMSGPGATVGWRTEVALDLVEGLIAARQRILELELALSRATT
jgi:hypothetical protein